LHTTARTCRRTINTRAMAACRANIGAVPSLRGSIIPRHLSAAAYKDQTDTVWQMILGSSYARRALTLRSSLPIGCVVLPLLIAALSQDR
jgi:hypothetical protein